MDSQTSRSDLQIARHPIHTVQNVATCFVQYECMGKAQILSTCGCTVQQNIASWVDGIGGLTLAERQDYKQYALGQELRYI